jgi:hypothetical protein
MWRHRCRYEAGSERQSRWLFVFLAEAACFFESVSHGTLKRCQILHRAKGVTAAAAAVAAAAAAVVATANGACEAWTVSGSETAWRYCSHGSWCSGWRRWRQSIVSLPTAAFISYAPLGKSTWQLLADWHLGGDNDDDVKGEDVHLKLGQQLWRTPLNTAAVILMIIDEMFGNVLKSAMTSKDIVFECHTLQLLENLDVQRDICAVLLLSLGVLSFAIPISKSRMRAPVLAPDVNKRQLQSNSNCELRCIHVYRSNCWSVLPIHNFMKIVHYFRENTLLRISPRHTNSP